MLLKRDDDIYWIDTITPTDPINRLIFRVFIATYLIGGNQMNDTTKEIDWLKSTPKLDRSLIQLFGTDYYLVACRVVDREEVPRHEDRDVTFEAVSIDQKKKTADIHKLLCAVFAPLPEHITRLRPQIDFEEHLAALFSGSTSEPAERDHIYFKGGRPALARQLCVDDVRMRRQVSVLDHFDRDLHREIKRLSQSPLLGGPDGLRPNLVVFRKSFSRDRDAGIRYEHYHYDPDPFIEQDDLEAAFRRILNRKVRLVQSKKYRFGGNDDPTELWFRRELRQFQQRGTLNGSESLKVLATPISPHLRLMVDFVLFSGSSLQYPDPFATGQIGWVHPDAPESVREIELKRLALLHYLMLAGAPDEVRKPNVLILPIRISGAVCMAVACIVDAAAIDDQYEEPFGTAMVDANEFQYRTFLYHSLIRELENRLRRRMKESYLRAIGELISDQILRDYRRGQTNEEDHTAPKLRDISDDGLKHINCLLKTLNRFCPYDTIEVHRDEPATREGEVVGKFTYDGHRTLFFLHTRRNPCFDRARLHRFLSTEHVQRRIQETANARIGEWRSYRTR
ncbi:MAG: hypothetical protein AAFQ58_08275 [Pseudomonadota bacterium]